MVSGDRSPLFYWGGGAAKPLSTGTYAGPVSMLAFWMGGANWHHMLIPPQPPYVPTSDMGGGVPDARHRRAGVIRDDEELLEFIRIWTLWNDNE